MPLIEDYPARNLPVVNLWLAARHRKTRPQPVNLRLRQLKKFAHGASLLWEL
jgi:hypothetical protein